MSASVVVSKDPVCVTAGFAKDVSLIHIHAPHMNLVPKKLLNALLFQSKGHKGPIYQCRVADLLEQIGYTSRDMGYFRAGLDYLMTTAIEWNILDDRGRNIVGKSTFLSSYEMVNGKEIEYAFSPHLLERIHSPEVFALLDLAVMRRFTRAPSLSLYETCKRFNANGATPWEPIVVWRKILDAMDSHYDEVKRFMDKVVRPSVAEVNNHSDIELDIETRRGSDRKISDMRLVIREREQEQQALDLAAPALTPAQQELFYILANDWGLNDALATSYVVTYSEDHLRGNIAVTMEVVKKGGVKNSQGFLRRAIEQDFRKKESIEDKMRREEEARRVSSQVEAKAEVERQGQERRVLESRVWSHVAGLDADARAEIFDAFTKTAGGLFRFSVAHREAFVMKGIIEHSPMIRAALTDYVAKRMGARDDAS